MNNKKSNILIAIESFFDGGAEMFAIRLANEMAKSHNVYFVELFPYLTKSKKQIAILELDKVKLIQPGVNRIGNFLYKNSFTEKLVKEQAWPKLGKLYKWLKRIEIMQILKKSSIDIVNSHSWDSDVYFASLKSPGGFKLVSTLHGHYEFLVDKRFNFESITKKAIKNIDEIIYTTELHNTTISSFDFPPQRMHKIFYGIKMNSIGKLATYNSHDVLNLCLIARGIKEKGWEEAINAIIKLNKEYPNKLKLYLVGEGNFVDELKLKYTNSMLSFEGYQDNIDKYLADAHIGLLPTYYVGESLPNSVIEYLTYGKPVISTDVGSIKEMMSANGKIAGKCISLTGNTVLVDELFSAIKEYLIYPEKVEKHSILALQAAEKFSMNTCIGNYLKIYNKNE